VPLWIFTLLAVAFAVVFVVFAFVGEYTRRERVEGFLVGRRRGGAHLQLRSRGVVTELLVKEGDEGRGRTARSRA